MTEPILREVLLSFWKVHILHHAEAHPVYGQWMLNELESHGYRLSPGTLYPLLARMEGHGWLKGQRDPGSSTKARREYVLTEEGARALSRLRRQVGELFDEVVGEAKTAPVRGPGRRPATGRARRTRPASGRRRTRNSR